MILTPSIGGLNIEGENDSYDFGSGAGFYVDATKAPYNAGYNMYSYVTEELPKTVFAAFSSQLDSSRVSITGHSMGGHGALTLVCDSCFLSWAEQAEQAQLDSLFPVPYLMLA